MDKHAAVTSEGLEFLAGKARQAALQLQDIAHDHRVEALRSMARAIECILPRSFAKMRSIVLMQKLQVSE